jgi:ABC-2 type transport system ATP-binding protein
MNSDAAPAIRIRGLQKCFPSFVLGPLDLTVPHGTVYGLIGPNGAGKTTTLDLIMGMGAPSAGTIEVLGLDHRAGEVEFKRRVGYVSPELSFDAWRSVERLLDFLRPFYPTWDAAYCSRLLERFEIGGERRIAALSLGQRTRLALVAALAHRPELLILDEPTSGLDAIGKHQFFEEMLALIKEEARTVLISSNNLPDVERFADHLGIIDRGKMLLEGPADALLERFRIVDLRASGSLDLRKTSGLRVLRHEGDRWRVLVDSATADRAALSTAEILSESPLTLEELFVALLEETK